MKRQKNIRLSDRAWEKIKFLTTRYGTQTTAIEIAIDQLYEKEKNAMSKYVTVINAYGKEIDYEAAVNLMDDDIREQLHAELAPCSEQEFFDAYCKAHREKYGEDFEPAKANPVW
ncbi:MAG: hypothetical protein D6694_12285 [Gammaproteobacteria bacterium]|nr:MAG: hypothetical protein D6694_12285 [Gammaproteobacteria bacterium]